ncbi:hypothetical protein [Paucibacter soli]|uniref:hypothetical protein n=1 Tax=Paucibacter soli TaxID=3133433 RepID=UPI00309F1E8E
MILTNGTNAFTVDAEAYKFITVQVHPQGSGVSCLMGGSGPDDTALTKLASFGSELGAKNAHAQLMKAHAGIGGEFRLGQLGKWVGGLAGLFFVALMLGTLSAPSASAGDQAARQVHQQQAVGSKSFNPGEPTLEQLAAGQYEFKPQLQAPSIEPPALNCAPR